MKIDKKLILFIVILIVLLWYPFSKGESKTSIDQMKEAFITQIEEDAYNILDEKELRKYFQIEPSEINGYYGLRSKDTMSAETLLIIRLHSMKDAEAIENKLQIYIENEHKKYDGYSANQVRILDNYTMIKKKGYIFLSISDYEEWKAIFEKNL